MQLYPDSYCSRPPRVRPLPRRKRAILCSRPDGLPQQNIRLSCRIDHASLWQHRPAARSEHVVRARVGARGMADLTDGARDTSAKAAPRSAAPQQQTALKALGPPPGVDVRTMVQPGLDNSSLRSVYEKTLAPGAPFTPPLPGPPTLGEGLAHRGFDPSRGAVGRQFGHSKEFSTKEPPPAPPPMPSQSQAPDDERRVVAGGRPPKVPEHREGLRESDRALIGVRR